MTEEHSSSRFKRARHHVDNPYRETKPDFAKLAADYPELEKHVIRSPNGSVHVDLKTVNGQRELTAAILKQDFGLIWHLPEGHLCPTVPSRIDYILWMRDVALGPPARRVDGPGKTLIVDVGTGASCIYPLLGTRLLLQSQFIAIDNDSEALASARANVSANGLNDRIAVRYGTFFSALAGDDVVDFTLCNPPFYAVDEDIGCHPRRQRSGSCTQLITDGGESKFLGMLAQQSAEKRNIKWFSTLIGFKRDVQPFESKLKALGAEKVVQTVLQPARTARWAVAWTFPPDKAATLNLCSSARASLVVRWCGATIDKLMQNIVDVLDKSAPAVSRTDDSIQGAGIHVKVVERAEYVFELDMRNLRLPSGKDFHDLARHLKEVLSFNGTESSGRV
eukprot:Plantae.Rhodophyta-Purpureofilum_apyrenoidigerum.ctg4552.p1 GENE.Plantae.Rhodophyta-Purpureofilum_apyrenoidigerum.ctg4552~~Plantae.Rhodophyta-Purpureofilum_apyrenoidigerum.ctg4552.p1  ORF type:complete len:421 (-),score=41.32 Plantae.Rhodophyta-Purpureofilum_apyrenoidigerum.ctg4552:1282-2457(-)